MILMVHSHRAKVKNRSKKKALKIKRAFDFPQSERAFKNDRFNYFRTVLDILD